MTTAIRPSELVDIDQFVDRHVGPNPAEVAAMTELLGYANLDDFIDAVVPAAIRLPRPLNLPAARTEPEVLADLRTLASRNRIYRSYIGLGYYGCHTPPVIQRNILENPGWYTAYTPYQAEIAQGRLEALLNFQTMVMDLTGMAIANASLLDEGTAAAEAMQMSHNLAPDDRNRFLVSRDCHPQTIEVVRTRAAVRGISVDVGDHSEFSFGPDVFGVLLQYPASDGAVHDYRALVEQAHAAGVLVTAAADLLALALLTPPGEWGADIVVGSTQRFGVPMGFGGPHAAYFATRDEYKRQIPGRIIGVSRDADGRPALRMALQTREQHIRREKATSNVCTAQVLLAVMAGMYAVWHGPEGIARIARRVHAMTATLAAGLERLGFRIVHRDYFDTLRVDLGQAESATFLEIAQSRGINLHGMDQHTIGISLDETTTVDDLADLLAVFNKGESASFTVDDLGGDVNTEVDVRFARTSPYLTHPVFNTHHSETEMLRYMRMLESRDLSLVHSMIPLGSCTMKLNATTEMIPVTWPEFGQLHPFAPAEQTEGYLELFRELESALGEITGFAGVSLQPNAGSQGEFAGLLVISRYHKSRGDTHRDVCLIPQSAHGTNPASAVMAGMKVVVVKTDPDGNIDVADLRARAEQHADNLAALMVTYPSTHGVFETSIREVCEIVHEHGGQVYMDGANMNAMVGVARPGDIGADVCHLNLHKTFCIPHGGGGPGVGPCAVKSHLAPFLPRKFGEESPVGMVSAASFGSASILPISWMYIVMMGQQGLRKATQVALLNANYIANRLEAHYPTLYTGRNGLVAHECILDLRPLKDATGIGAEDVAKRLIDFGFHAPTLSFPVSGTLMVEPTESESRIELDRFIDAMIQIRDEIRAIEEGKLDREDNPLKNAPHTATMVSASEWTHAYPRELAAFPLASLKLQKYWPPVARVDNVYGDKHIMCACIPVDAYKEEAEA